MKVQNVGKDSMQGDAQFCWLLQKMGCKVEQTVDCTTVEVLHPVSITPVSVPQDLCGRQLVTLDTTRPQCQCALPVKEWQDLE